MLALSSSSCRLWTRRVCTPRTRSDVNRKRSGPRPRRDGIENTARDINICSCSPPKWNPQNVPDSNVKPDVTLSPVEVVILQLKALQNVHEPRMNHGIQCMYEFCEGSGSMERSRYFGYSKDLYHFDHFLGGFQNEFGDLMDNTGFEISETVMVNELGEQAVDVVVSNVRANVEYEKKFTFCLVRRDFGKKKGCLMTSRIIKHD